MGASKDQRSVAVLEGLKAAFFFNLNSCLTPALKFILLQLETEIIDVVSYLCDHIMICLNISFVLFCFVEGTASF